MKKILTTHYSLLIIILIISAFLRFYNLTPQVGGLPPGLYSDEAMDGNNALETLSTAPPAGGFKVFYPENNGREGLFMNIQAIFLKFLMPLYAGPEPWMLRIVSAIFGLLTVLGVYFLAKELFKRPALFEKNVSEAERARFPNEARESEAESQAASERLGERDRGFSKIKPGTVALLSAFLMATSFWHINFSRIGFRAIMAPFFLVWTIYFLLWALRQIKEQKPAKFYVLNSIIGGIFYGLGFYSYIVYRATPLLILIILLFYWFKNKDKLIRKKILLSTCYFLLVTFIVALPLGLYFLHNPQDFFGRTSQISVLSSPTPLKDLGFNILKTAGMFNIIGDWNWRHNYAGRPELFWPVGILFLVGIVMSIFSLSKKEKTFPVANIAGGELEISERVENLPGTPDEGRQGGKFLSGTRLEFLSRRPIGGEKFSLLILLSWLIIAALPVIISNEGIPHALRSILMAPAVFILAAAGASWLYEKFFAKIQNFTKLQKFIINFSSFIILSLLVLEAYTTYFIKWGQNPNVQGAFNADYSAIARQLNSLPKELPKYVVVEAKGVDVRGIPMPAQTVMFITDTFTPEKQKEKNIFYVLPNQTSQIPQNSYTVELK